MTMHAGWPKTAQQSREVYERLEADDKEMPRSDQWRYEFLKGPDTGDHVIAVCRMILYDPHLLGSQSDADKGEMYFDDGSQLTIRVVQREPRQMVTYSSDFWSEEMRVAGGWERTSTAYEF